MESDAEFEAAKWETFPCGHKVRLVQEFDEIVLDLKALHGIDAMKELTACVEEERQHHLSNTCKDPQDIASITSRQSDDGKTTRFFLTVNGEEIQELGKKT